MIASSPSIHRPPIKGLICIWLIAASLALFALGELPLRDFDEATVARVALELSEKVGLDRLLPTLWGEPYLNKPPGLHWFISLAINSSRIFKGDSNQLPSEFCIRFFPALFSTFVVPLGGLIQWKLRPDDKISAIATSLILLTLLPVARHGRLAMLDGTHLSSIALLWFFLVSLDDTKWDKFRFLGAGFSCSFMLLLKAPLMIPALVAGSIPWLWNKNFQDQNIFYSSSWFLFGLIPGVLWHFLNALFNGSGALWLWWGDGAGRVLFHAGTGSELGFLIPIIEFLEGSWPWILLWPFGLALACRQLNTRWGSWALFTQLIIVASILPLKMQLPWYSHPIWLPFSLLCGPPISWLIQRNGINFISRQTLLKWVPFIWSLLGFLFISLCLAGFLKLIPWILPYVKIILPIGIGWFVGGTCLNNPSQKYREIGFLTLSIGSLISLFVLMASNLWIWELNENWDVRPVAKILQMTRNEKVYISDSFERPSLNWYAGKQVKSIDRITGSKLLLKKGLEKSLDDDQKNLPNY